MVDYALFLGESEEKERNHRIKKGKIKIHKCTNAKESGHQTQCG